MCIAPNFVQHDTYTFSYFILYRILILLDIFYTVSLLRLLLLMFLFGQFLHYNGSISFFYFISSLGGLIILIRIERDFGLKVFLNLTIQSTTYWYKYMHVSHIFWALWSCNYKFSLHIFLISTFTQFFYFKCFGRKIRGSLSIWPVLFRLMTSLRIIKCAEHDNSRYIFVIDGFPKTVKFFERSLTKHCIYLTIN